MEHTCPTCGQVFQTLASLIAHMTRQHTPIPHDTPHTT
mgnify:CR=1 FL=1